MEEKLIYSFSFLIIGILIMMMFASLDYNNNIGWNNGFNVFTNSDSSLLYQLSTDILKSPSSITDWDFATCYYLFPNLLVILCATILFSNPSLVLFAASVMQFLILIILVNILFKKVFKNISKYTLIISNFSILLLIIYGIKIDDFCTFTSQLFIPMHIGALINAIAALIFTFNYIETKKRKHIVFLILISIIAILSDLMYLIYFSVPISLGLLTIIMFKTNFRTKEYLKLLISLISSGVIGFVIHRIFVIANILNVRSFKSRPDNIANSFHLMMHQFYLIITGYTFEIFIAAIIITSLLLSSFVALKVLFNKKKVFINTSDNNLIYFIFVIYSFFLSIISPIITGNYSGFDNIRYIIPPVYLIIFNTALLIDFFIISKQKAIYLQRLAIVFIIIYLCFIVVDFKKDNPFNAISKISNYYPAIVKATDELSKEYKVKNGLGNYWDARFITIFSKQKVTVNAIESNFHPMIWANNPHAFFYSSYSDVNPVVYNFVVMHYLQDTNAIYNVFDKKDIKKVLINGYGFYLIPNFKAKDDLSLFELINQK